MEFPKDYKYSKEHAWLKVLDNEMALVGITEFAQSELGEVVYMDLPAVGKQFDKDEGFGSVEAVKTTSDLFMPVSGQVVEVNASLKDNAPLINSASFTEGWMIKIKMLNPSEAEALLDASAYEGLVS